MANTLYSYGREGILDTTINMTGDIRAMLVKSDYTFNDTHKFIQDIESGGTKDNGRTGTFSDHTYNSGVFDAADITLISLFYDECNAIIIFQHTSNDSTARLIAYIDSPETGLPCTPSLGQTVNIVWDNGVNRIFKL